MGAVLAVAPAVPDLSETLQTAAGNLTTAGFDTFTDILPYAVGLLALSWGWTLVKGNLGFKKKKPV